MIERIFSADSFHQPLNDKKCKVELANIDEEECEVQDKEEDDKIIMIGRTGTVSRSFRPMRMLISRRIYNHHPELENRRTTVDHQVQ